MARAKAGASSRRAKDLRGFIQGEKYFLVAEWRALYNLILLNGPGSFVFFSTSAK